MVAKIATGELEYAKQAKSGRVRSGKVGGKARAKKLSQGAFIDRYGCGQGAMEERQR
jgi:hypothetical protein